MIQMFVNMSSAVAKVAFSIQGVTKLSRHLFFAISACTRTFLTVGAGKLDESVPNLFVLTSPGYLTSGSDNVTSERYELLLESLSNFRSGQRREKNKKSIAAKDWNASWRYQP